jgi:urease accessory protein
MTRIDQVLTAGTWDKAAATDTVLIDFDRRHRRRIALRTEGGADVLLDLPQAVRLLGDRIRIRADHVIAEMVEGLGGHVDDIEAPFDPEPGAYAAGGGHHLHHGDDHDHDHD